MIIRFDSNCSKSMATGGGGSSGGGEPAARSLQLDTSGIIAPLRREEILSSWGRVCFFWRVSKMRGPEVQMIHPTASGWCVVLSADVFCYITYLDSRFDIVSYRMDLEFLFQIHCRHSLALIDPSWWDVFFASKVCFLLPSTSRSRCQ